VTAVASTPGLDYLEQVSGALRAARDHLLGLQHPDGWWKAELETNVTMDAEDLMLRHFLGILDPEVARSAARWIRSNQRQDGTWGTFHGSPPDLSATIEAYVGLRLAGDEPDAPHMQAAAAWVQSQGGIAASRTFTRIWLAMMGRWDWEELPVLPAEIMFLPPWVPLNIYDFGCWARQTVVALTVVMAYRPARPLPFGIDELRAEDSPADSPPRSPAAKGWRHTMEALGTVEGRFFALDRLLHRYERLPDRVAPRRFMRRSALRRAEQWIIRRQENDGLWGGIQPPVVYSIIALHLLGYPLDHPVVRAALDGLDDFVIEDHRGRRLEACQSPIWDTALAVVALHDAGVDPAAQPMVSAGRWLLGQEVTASGDWAVRRPGLAPGGWAFEFENDNYPDIDDTAEVVLALRRIEPALGPDVAAACARAVAWAAGMQSRSGGWGAFDADNDSQLVASLPFCDFGEVTDPPSADVTAHMIEMLAAEGPGVRASLHRGVGWLSEQQEPDGSWFGRWGVNYIYGTGAAVPALITAGVDEADPRIRRAVDWLVDHQNPDGGWGEDLRSYVDNDWRGRGTSTASQTAWALLALLAAGEAGHPATRAGIDWLLNTQLPEGTWDEPWFTGTGFPWDFSINYHLYRLVWPLMALGRYLQAGAALA
jgi:squalene-hopene/tetraprenyl-beta-curcumene cyclase